MSHRRRSLFTLRDRGETGSTVRGNGFSSRVVPIACVSGGKSRVAVSYSRRPHPRAAFSGLSDLGPVFRKKAMATNGTSNVGSNTSMLLLVSRRGTDRLKLRPLKACVISTATKLRPSVVKTNPICSARGTLGETNLAVGSVSLARLGRTFTSRSLTYVGRLNTSSRQMGMGNKTVTFNRPLKTDNTHVLAALLRRVGHEGSGCNLTAVYIKIKRKVSAVIRQ